MSRKSKAAEFVNEGYRINVIGRNVYVTDAMKNYAIDKVSKIEKFTSRIIDIQVVMDVIKFEHHVDILMRVGHMTMKASATDKDMYAAIDEATAKISKQFRRYTKRLNNHHAKGLTEIDMNVNVFTPPSELDLINDAIEDENQNELLDHYQPHHVVSKETKPLKNLSLDEAIIKMELSGDVFMLYRAEEDRKLKVIYRRNDGNYGIIEPEV